MTIIYRPFIALLFLFLAFNLSFAEGESLSSGKVNANDINIRSDSTVSSEIICKVDKGYKLEIISELYDWYKIKLPKKAPSFVKKDLVVTADEKTAKVIKDNVNIRLKADESSVIIGRAAKGETVNVAGERGEWLRIEPVNNSFGWIHKNFVNKVPFQKEAQAIESAKKEKNEETITVEGVIKPKTMTKIATHKLISREGSIYLLKGDKENLTTLNNYKAKVTGRIINSDKYGAPLIEIIKTELLD